MDLKHIGHLKELNITEASAAKNPGDLYYCKHSGETFFIDDNGDHIQVGYLPRKSPEEILDGIDDAIIEDYLLKKKMKLI